MPRFRIFQNDVPTINAGDLIRNKKNKEIYSGVKNAVDNNQMTSEGYTFDSGGCLRSAPSYDAFLALTRGWSLGSIRYEDISNISTSIASDFADPGAAWAQRYNTINLTDYDIVRDASLNSVHNTGGKYAINVIHRDISSVEMNHFLTGSTIKPKTKYSALNPAYSASIQLDPSNILYSTGCSAKSINNNDDAKWKQLVSTQQSSEQYRNNIYRIVKNTDWQFSYPRKFNIKQSRISNSIIPNSSSDSFNATGGIITTYTYSGINYKVHTFLYDANDTSNNATTYIFTTNDIEKSMDFLIVAAGGEGGKKNGGGGGGGGVVWGTGWNVPVGAHTIKVGNGIHGSGGRPNNTPHSWVGHNGADSTFEIENGTEFTALGGGGGGSFYNIEPWPGGSGGGGWGGLSWGGSWPRWASEGLLSYDTAARERPDISTHPLNSASGDVHYKDDSTTYPNVKVYGNDGGQKGEYTNVYHNAGGGGAGAQGNELDNTEDSYVGADGIYCPLRYGPAGSTNHSVTPPSGWDNTSTTDFPQYYAAGGSGRDGTAIPGNPKGGGGGGDGNGGHPGEPHTGGGGGGHKSVDAEAIGGSGIVVIRYQVS